MRGDGGIYKRGNVYWIHYSRDGKRIKRSARTDKRSKAERLLREMRSSGGRYPEPLDPLAAARLAWSRRLTAPGGHCDLPGSFLLVARRPLVYAWFRGDEPLYVGMSREGLARPLSAAHHQIKDIQSTDVLRVWPCSSAIEAHEAERRLIAELRPKLNR